MAYQDYTSSGETLVINDVHPAPANENVQNAPVDASTERYRKIVNFDLGDSTAYDTFVAEYPEAWDTYYGTGSAPAYSYANAVALQEAIAFYLYYTEGTYTPGTGLLVDNASGSTPAAVSATTTVYTYTVAQNGVLTVDYTLSPSVTPTAASTVNLEVNATPVATHALPISTEDQYFSDSTIEVTAGDSLTISVVNNDATATYAAMGIRINGLGTPEALHTMPSKDSLDFSPYARDTGNGVQTLENPNAFYDMDVYNSVTNNGANPLPKVQMDGDKVIGANNLTTEKPQYADMYSAQQLAATEYKTTQELPQSAYDWGGPYATGKHTY